MTTSSQTNLYNDIAKKIDKNFMPIFLIAAVIYAVSFYLFVSINTKAEDRVKLLKRNIKKTVTIAQNEVKKEEVKKVETPVETEVKSGESKEEAAVDEVVSKNVSKETKQAVRKTASQRKKARANRKARRSKAKAARKAKGRKAAAARLAKIRAKSRGYSSGSSSAYTSFTGSSGGGNIAGKLASSGGVSIGGAGGAGGGGVGRSNGGGIGVGAGGIGDFLSESDYGEISSVEGVKDFKVTPLKVNRGKNKSTRTISQVQTAVNRKQKGLTKCIKRARSKFPSLTGSIKYTFTIKKNGKVTKVRILKRSWNNKRYGKIAEKCIIRAIKSWRFSKVSKGGNLTLNSIIVF